MISNEVYDSSEFTYINVRKVKYVQCDLIKDYHRNIMHNNRCGFRENIGIFRVYQYCVL